MKKLYLFLVALMVSIAVNAAPSALYLMGGPAGGVWNTSAKSLEFTPKGNGVFVYEGKITSGDFFRLHDGTTQYGASADKEEIAMNDAGHTANYGENNNAFKANGEITKLTVVFADGNNAKLYAGDAPTEPVNPPAENYNYCLHGQIFADGDNWNSKAMEAKGDGIYTYTTTLYTGKFGIRKYTTDMSKGTWYNATKENATITTSDKTVSVGIENQGGVSNIDNQITGECTITFNENDLTVTIEPTGDDPNPPTPSTPVEKEYTVYFYDKNNWGNVNIWAWQTVDGKTKELTNTGSAWPGAAMTLTDLKYQETEGGEIYKVYKWTFNASTASDISAKFTNNKANEQNTVTISDLDLYYYDSASQKYEGRKEGTYKFYEEPTVDPYDVTFYYINKGYANGWKCPEAHVFAGEASQDVPGVKTNDRYKDPQDGNIYDVIKYVFTANKEISKYQLCFKVGTSYSGSNFALKKGALYCTGAIANENPSWYIAGEDTSSKTIYFNMGADYMLDEDKKWVVDGKKIAPYAIFQNKAGEWSMKKQMEKVDGEDCMYKVTFDASMYKSVKFSNDKSGDALLEYPIDSEVALNHNKELAGEGWYTYIYVADGDYVESTKTHRYWATQSWLPFDEYLKLRDGVRTQYCVASSVTDWHKNAYKVKMNPEEGVCLFETESLTPGTKFKLSYIVPFDNNQVANGHTGDDANIQRWWATFNLGIVGPEVSDATQDGSNKYVSYELRKPKRYNHYCKYDWNVAYKASEVPDGSKVYVIIDPKHQTTTLITFNPQPKLNKVEVGTITAKHLDEYENVEVTEVGSNIKGKDVHGEARVRKVNNLLTTAMIYPSPMPEEFYNMYQVKYTVYQNGEPVATFLRKDLENLDSEHQGTTDGQKWYKVDLSSLAPGATDVVSFDATYTLKKDDGSLTDLMFGSKVHTQTATANTKYPEFTEAKVLAHYATPSYRDDATGEMVWDAIVKVGFTYEGESGGNTYVYYPEVEATTAEGLQGYIADIKNRYYSEFHRAKYDWKDVNGNEYKPHTKYDGTGEYKHEINNWSIIAREAGVFHIYLPGVGRTVGDYKNPGKLAEFTFDLNLTAAYPFLVDKMINTYQELRAPKRAEELAATTPKDVVFQRRTLSLNDIQVNVDNIGTSGINDVDIDAIEGEGELYNLQGVRVYGEPTPGIYLRRQGNQVVKVAIR